ncbi:glutathione S-transferase family protein [Bartonella sp. LJL80]
MPQSLFIVGTDYSTFTRSVRIYCELMGVSYETGMTVHGETLALRSAALKDYHPFGKIPVLLQGELKIFETTAICRYLDALYPDKSLRPTAASDAALVDAWAQVISIYVDKAVLRDYVLEYAFPKGENGKVRLDIVAKALPAAHESLAVVSKQLAEQAFLCGKSFTLADAILLPILDYASQVPTKAKLFAGLDNLLRYVERLRAIPAVQKVISGK